jgi:hypothetical protein
MRAEQKREGNASEVVERNYFSRSVILVLFVFKLLCVLCMRRLIYLSQVVNDFPFAILISNGAQLSLFCSIFVTFSDESLSILLYHPCVSFLKVKKSKSDAGVYQNFRNLS